MMMTVRVMFISTLAKTNIRKYINSPVIGDDSDCQVAMADWTRTRPSASYGLTAVKKKNRRLLFQARVLRHTMQLTLLKFIQRPVLEG
jgi:hypothetical protein